MAAVTNYHKPGSLKQQKLLSQAEGQKSEISSTGLKSDVSRNMLPLEGLEENMLSLFSFVATGIPWLVVILLYSPLLWSRSLPSLLLCVKSPSASFL